VVFGNRIGALYPCGNDQIAQHACAGSETLFGELLPFGSAGSVESVVFVELVELFYERVRVVQVGEIVVPFIADGMKGRNERLYLGGSRCS
jgi:hypothetical protein